MAKLAVSSHGWIADKDASSPYRQRLKVADCQFFDHINIFLDCFFRAKPCTGCHGLTQNTKPHSQSKTWCQKVFKKKRTEKEGRENLSACSDWSNGGLGMDQLTPQLLITHARYRDQNVDQLAPQQLITHAR